jgi:hypothetical protein
VSLPSYGLIRCRRLFGSVRGLIALIAILASALWAWGLWSAHARYTRVAGSFALYERRCRLILSGDPEEIERASWGGSTGSTDPDWNRRLLAYTIRMRERFEYAATHPWVRVRADPPPN